VNSRSNHDQYQNSDAPARLYNNQAQVNVSGTSVGQALNEPDRAVPELRPPPVQWTDLRKLRQRVSGRRGCAFLDGLNTEITETDNLRIIRASRVGKLNKCEHRAQRAAPLTRGVMNMASETLRKVDHSDSRPGGYDYHPARCSVYCEQCIGTVLVATGGVSTAMGALDLPYAPLPIAVPEVC